MTVKNETKLKCKVIVIKIASRCNMNCKYCYMYNMGDTTYKNQPKVMSDEVVDALIDRVYEHCQLHLIRKFTFVLHGGEPMLAGKEFFTSFVTKARTKFKDSPVRLSFGMQTNGALLTDDWCEHLGKLDIGIGVSLDGVKEVNDQNRIYHNGKGTYDDIVRGFKIACDSDAIKNPGLLSVINLEADPEETYNHFKSIGATSYDFLIPDGNYDSPPHIPESIKSETPFGDWMVKIFDLWKDDPTRPSIRYFKQIVYQILGLDFSADNIGTSHAEVLGIETNGDMEAVDSLKICGHGFTKGKANVKTMSFDEALTTPLANLYQLSHSILSSDCMACPVSEICGGGFLPHRYSKVNGFDNPSIFCKDLLKIIVHIQNYTLSNLPEDLLEKVGIEPVNYDEALKQIKENSAKFKNKVSPKLISYAKS